MFVSAASAFAAETDQYLTWGMELEDSAEAVNEYLNTQLQEYLDGINSGPRRFTSREELTRRFYQHLFKGLYYSRMRRWLGNSSEVDRYPSKEVGRGKYQRMSIYRKPAFPFILPMARTVRIGDVYLGTDKIGHFFGFGRRYHMRFHQYLAEGYSRQEAIDKTIVIGIIAEKSWVGSMTDGVFSHADMEANYQGFLMALDFCEGDNPYLRWDGDQWHLTRPIDLRDYVTPDFDESYNNSHYFLRRTKLVLPLLKNEYGEMLRDPRVQERFRRYRKYEPSYSVKFIDAYFEKRGVDSQREHSLEALVRQEKRADSELKAVD